MKYTIEIDDKSKAGRSLVELAREIAKNLKGVKVFEKYDEAEEDAALLRLMEEGRKSGYADNEQVERKLGLK